MAVSPLDIIDRRVVQNFRTSGSSAYIESVLKDSAATGEIIIQLTESTSGTSLWTLGKDGESAIQFINKKQVEEMIEGGSSTDVEAIKESVGLNDDGSIVKNGESVWGNSPDYFDSASTVVEAVLGVSDRVASLKISGITPSSTNVKEEFALMSTDGVPIGDTIKIYKDSSLYNVYLGHVDDALEDPTSPVVTPGTGNTALCFIYLKTDGQYQLVAVDVESFLQEKKFASGVTVDEGEHIVHGVVDPTSEAFLTVGANGFKLSGVQDAIDIEANRAKAAEVSIDAAAGFVKGASGETRTYGHSGTNYLDNNSNIKADTEGLDSLLGKVESTPASSADTVFDSTHTVAKNISDIKKDLAAFKEKLTIRGKENAYSKVTVETADSGTSIEVSAKTQEIATSTAVGQGLADAFDVRTYAVKGVDNTSLETSAGVKVEVTQDGDKLLDFSNIKIDCGQF